MSGRSYPDDDSAILIAGAVVLALIWSKRASLNRMLSHGYVYLALSTGAALLLIVCTVAAKKLAPRRAQLRPLRWPNMSGGQFEDQVVLWLKLSGFSQVVKTEYFDQGIDVIAAKPGVMLGVQVKRSSRSVGVAAVRAAVAGIRSYGCNQAMVVTNATFTTQAKRLAQANACELVDGARLKAAGVSSRSQLRVLK